MPRPKHTPEIIIGKLREVEVLVAKGATVAEASRQIGVTEQTLYRWRKEYGGMRVDQARRLKDLEAENTRLKKLVADLTRRMGRHLRRPGRRHSLARSPAPPRPGRPDRGLQLSTPRARSPRPRKPQKPGMPARSPTNSRTGAAVQERSLSRSSQPDENDRHLGLLLRHKWGKFSRH